MKCLLMGRRLNVGIFLPRISKDFTNINKLSHSISVKEYEGIYRALFQEKKICGMARITLPWYLSSPTSDMKIHLDAGNYFKQTFLAAGLHKICAHI